MNDRRRPWKDELVRSVLDSHGRRREGDIGPVPGIAAHKKYRPFAVVTTVDPSQPSTLAAHMPWVEGMKMIDHKPTVYVCRNFACDAPSTDASVLS